MVDRATSLATSWKAPLEAETAGGLTCVSSNIQDGAAFTAADVVFSYERASEGCRCPVVLTCGRTCVVDDFTIDFVKFSPDPLFPSSIGRELHDPSI
jgi:peptide/nickel transport system substrate-binding protein